MPDPNASVVEVRTYFVRGRNALVARADFGPLYIDYYLHRADHDLVYQNEHDAMLKEALATLTLHLASRPQEESCGWTFNFHEPHLNLFVTGASRPGRVAGRLFTEDVREFGKNLLIGQTIRPNRPPVQSLVEFTSGKIFSAVQEYYEQSEQRMARIFCFEGDEEDLVMVSAQPDCDEAWLAALTGEDIRALDTTEQLSLLEQRTYVWECGCSVDRLYPILGKLADGDLDEVFGGQEIVTLTCPRCGARYRAAREQFEAWKERA